MSGVSSGYLEGSRITLWKLNLMYVPRSLDDRSLGSSNITGGPESIEIGFMRLREWEPVRKEKIWMGWRTGLYIRPEVSTVKWR